MLTLNAATGQVWKADIEFTPSQSTAHTIRSETILDIYLAYLGLDGGGSYVADDTLAYTGFADDMLYVIAERTYIEKSNHLRMTMYLSSQASDNTASA
jgi:hypothetical protein